MKRRDFIHRASLTLAGVPLGVSVMSCDSEQSPKKELLTPNDTSFEVVETTIEMIHQAYRSGALSAVELVSAYLSRIDKYDSAGPELRSVLQLNPEALEIAEQLDQDQKNGDWKGPLHGIPVLLKGNIDTGDQLETTAGAWALKGAVQTKDAPIVKALRAAGAIILGKANLSEWANFKAHPFSSGYSALGGQTKNPYDPEYCPCGSSAGSAVAVAANLCTVSIGTETNGSIVCPASFNGLVGIKPTLNLVSRRGIIPIAHSQDTAGPMARTVMDAAILLSAIAGYDHNDVQVLNFPGRINDNYTQLSKNSLQGARIGYLDVFEGGKPSSSAFEKWLNTFQEAGAEVIKLDPIIPDIEQHYDASFKVLLFEFKQGLNAYLDAYQPGVNPVRSLEEIIALNAENSSEAMPLFGQELLEYAQESTITEEEYQAALTSIQKVSRTGIDNALKEHQLQAIVIQTNGKGWKIDHENGDQFGSGSSSFAAWSGYPSITVPCDMIDGLPVGLSFIGSAFSEATLLNLAYSFEQHTQARVAPDLG